MSPGVAVVDGQTQITVRLDGLNRLNMMVGVVFSFANIFRLTGQIRTDSFVDSFMSCFC